MNVDIPCDTYFRLAEIPAWFNDDPARAQYKQLFVERKNNKVFVVATNQKVAVIERVQDQPGPDEYTSIALSDTLRLQCEKEVQFKSILNITSNDMLKYTSAKTQYGYIHPENIFTDVTDDLTHWREWFPDELPKKSKGHMMIAADLLYAVAQAAPTAAITFPTFIDCTKPVMLRDDNAENWFGLFFPGPMPDQSPVTFKDVPEWVK